ncbi:MAG: LysE family translocator [Pseudomonadota bacterium]
MTLEQLLAFNLALLAALAAPGPALLLCLKASVSGGWRQGLATGLGLATMASIWTFAALLGLDGLFTLFPWAYGALKALGAGYLLWIAWKTWRAADDPPPPAGEARRGAAYLSGLIVNIGNPKSVLFAAAVLVVIFPPDLSLGQSLLVAANHFALEAAFYGLFAAALGGPTMAARCLRLKPVLDRIAAVALGALGLRLLVSR